MKRRKQNIEKAWKVVDRIRLQMANFTTAEVQRVVDQAVREVRARHNRRRH